MRPLLLSVAPIIMLLTACTQGFTQAKAPIIPQIVDGRVLHPETGEPVDCELMAPFEARFPEMAKGAPRGNAWTNSYLTATNREIGGMHGVLWGLTKIEVRQGIAMSRACRGLIQKPPGTE